MDDIFVYCVQLPTAVKGMASLDENGDYTIYINNAYNAEQQREIYQHELRHVLSGHHRQGHRPLSVLEAEASGRAAPQETHPHTLPAPPPITLTQPPACQPAAAAAPARRLRRQSLTGMFY